MDERYKNTNGSFAVNKERLVDDFYQRLVESYSYSKSQIARRVSISDRSVADIAIWRSEDEKAQPQWNTQNRKSFNHDTTTVMSTGKHYGVPDEITVNRTV